MNSVRSLLHIGLGAVVVPASATPLLAPSLAQATDGASDGHVAPSNVDLGTLQSCTENFSLNKQNSRLISFDVKGPLASTIAIGTDVTPVFAYDNAGTTAYCEMKPAWNPVTPDYDVSGLTSMDTFMPNSGSRACFLFNCSSGTAMFDGLVANPSRTQFLIPAPSFLGFTAASESTLPRIILVPKSSSLTESQLVYDGAIPAVEYILNSVDPEDVFSALLTHGISLVRTKLATIDPDVLTTFDDVVPDDFSTFLGSPTDDNNLCVGPLVIDNSGDLTDFGAALIRTISHSVLHDMLLDPTSALFAGSVFGDKESGFDTCDYILIAALFNGLADDIVDRSIIEVMTVGPTTTTTAAPVLPDTGSDASNLLVAAGIAVAAGGALTFARRRRPA